MVVEQLRDYNDSSREQSVTTNAVSTTGIDGGDEMKSCTNIDGTMPTKLASATRNNGMELSIDTITGIAPK